jgi:hypothetical protein
MEARHQNSKILQYFNYNLEEAILAQRSSQVMFGSEFKHPDLLCELLQDHPNWEKFKGILLHGAVFPLAPIPEDERSSDLEFHLSRGNHKSAIKHDNILDELISSDIRHGFALPLLIYVLPFIKNASIAPLGCHEQETINEAGEHIPKCRMTHDQTFPGPSGKSVNLRVVKDQLPPCMFSHVLSRVLHYIVDLCHRHPSTRIYLCKFDVDAAYRRCHLSSQTASECLTVYKNTLIMALRLTFGGSPCPSLWGIISETINDLCNALITNVHWDHTNLYDPISDQLSEICNLPDDIPFHPARDLSVSLPINDVGLTDVYIDDINGIAPDIGTNASRVNRAIALAIQTVARPISPKDPIPRDPIISRKKLLAEGKMDECKVVLGWYIHTRSLLISLPIDKSN